MFVRNFRDKLTTKGFLPVIFTTSSPDVNINNNIAFGT